MSDLSTPEIADLYGALDSASANAVDGGAMSAYTLRTLAMQANRLTCVGHPLAVLTWRSDLGLTYDVATADDDFFLVHATPKWRQILPPFEVRKKPGLTRGFFRAMYQNWRLDTGSAAPTAYLRIETNAHPMDGAIDDESCIVLNSTAARGDADAYSGGAQSVPVSGDNPHLADAALGAEFNLDPGPVEQITLWLKAVPLTVAGVTDDYGSPNTDTFIESAGKNHIQISVPTTPTGVTWNSVSNSLNWARAGHWVDISGSHGEQPVIIGIDKDVVGSNDRGFLFLSPEIRFPVSLVGETMTIRQLPVMSFSGISIYAKSRTL